jgi:hypothetical protein
MRSVFLAALLVGWLAAAAAAQTDVGDIRLVVTGPAGAPVVASGLLASEAPPMRRSFKTNAEGWFTLSRVPFGVYILTVEAPGHVPQHVTVEVRSASPHLVPVSLAASPQLEQSIDVTADLPLVDTQRTGVSFAIAAPQLQGHLSAVPGRLVLDLVDQQPGWLMEANGVLHPRGSEYQTLFVVDGIPMDENRSPAFAPDLQENAIQAMSVLTGNIPAEYGRKISGVVEVSTNRDIQEGFHGSFDAGTGSFGMASGGASVTHGWAGQSLTVSASAARTDRYLDPPVVENFTNDGNLAGALVSYQLRATDRDRVQFTWQHRRSDFGVPNEIVQESAGQRQDNSRSDDALNGTWTHILGARSVLSTRGLLQHLSASLTSNPASTPVIVDQERSFTRGYVNASIATDIGRHQLKFGGDLVVTPVHEALAYQITDDDFADAGTAPTFDFADKRTSNEQSLFIQDTIRRGSLTFSAGHRVGADRRPGLSRVVRPRLSDARNREPAAGQLAGDRSDQPRVGAAAGAAIARPLLRSGHHDGARRRRTARRHSIPAHVHQLRRRRRVPEYWSELPSGIRGRQHQGHGCQIDAADVAADQRLRELCAVEGHSRPAGRGRVVHR